MQDYRKLQVWEKAHALVLAVYEATRAFPKDELYGLTSQLRRCSSSIPSNIVEGCGRSSNAELAKFLHYALGSANELEYQLLLSRDLGFLSPERHPHLAANTVEVKRMLSGLIAKLRPARRADA
jgi:four helix bundle protein